MCSLKVKFANWVAISINYICIISVYILPNVDISIFTQILDELKSFIRFNSYRYIICDNFNAKSEAWECHTGDRRGVTLEDWVAELGFGIVNTGSVPTCVRPQGTSIVDITIASPDLLPVIYNWQVLSDAETLSDRNIMSGLC